MHKLGMQDKPLSSPAGATTNTPHACPHAAASRARVAAAFRSSATMYGAAAASVGCSSPSNRQRCCAPNPRTIGATRSSLDSPIMRGLYDMAFADVPVVNQLLAATPSVPDWSPIVPYAIANPIYLDVDGNGRYDAPHGLPPFCSQPCDTDDECPFGEVCVGVCGFAIDGGCNIPRTLPAPD